MYDYQGICMVLAKGLGTWIIYLKFTESIEMVEDMAMDNISGVDVVDLEDESVEGLFKEALDSMEEVKRIADKPWQAGVSPPILHW